MKGYAQSTNKLTRSLAESQERAALSIRAAEQSTVLFRIYTERFDNLAELAARRFAGATIVPTEGVYNGTKELGAVVEVIAPYADRRTVVALASDIVDANSQECALCTIIGGPNRFDSFNVYGERRQ